MTTLQQFLQHDPLLVRHYLSAPETNPDDYPWEVHTIQRQYSQGQLTLCVVAGVEFSPHHDVEAFDGETLTVMVGERIVQIRRKGGRGARGYGISEIARELGVSRQRVHQKVKKCQNPYVKLKRGPRSPHGSKTPIVKVSEQLVPVKRMLTVTVLRLRWQCPQCGHLNGIRKMTDNQRFSCQKCFKRARLVR